MGNSPIYNTILTYIFFIIILLVLKPQFMYCNKKKKFKSFGLGQDKVFFCFPVVSIIAAIILYIFFTLLELIKKFL